MVEAAASGNPRDSRYWVKRSPRVAPENAPDSTPIRLMPTCADDRNLPGSSANFSATAAPLLPSAAMTLSLGAGNLGLFPGHRKAGGDRPAARLVHLHRRSGARTRPAGGGRFP